MCGFENRRMCTNVVYTIDALGHDMASLKRWRFVCLAVVFFFFFFFVFFYSRSRSRFIAVVLELMKIFIG